MVHEIKQNIGVVVLRFLSAIILKKRKKNGLLILHFIGVDLIIKMYNLICTSGYYSVYNERQMKKRCIKKSHIIATNKSKFSLQQIANNLNKKIPKVRLTTLSIADLLLAVNSNAILNIGTLNVKSKIEEDICVPSNNNYDTEQCNTNQSFDLMFCDNTNDIENIKGSAYLTEDVLSINEEPNTLIDSSKNIMSDLLLTADSNTALNIGISNVNNDIKDNSTILNKPSDVTENVECDEFDSTFIIYGNAYVVDKFKSPKKSLKILSEVPNVNNILVKETTLPMLTEKTDNIPYNNMQLSNKYSTINNNNASLNANETHILDNISTGTLVPPAEFTFIENQLKSNYEINDNNTDNESDTSITSKNSFDDSFHTSDCSMFEDTDEDQTENTREYITNTSKSKTVNSTLNLTSCLSKVAVWDDRNMYVETSNNPKSKKLSMCPYCKKLQTQFTRHLEWIHKNEEDVKKFSLLPKGNSERKKIIGILRRTGNFIYNTDSNINKGDLIVCRRPRTNKQAADFIPCAKCKGFFAKNNIRHHFRSCVQKQEPQRNVKLLGRTVACRIHHSACTLLRRLVFPVMREDNITQIIRYDELLIAYGNKLCQNKYRPQHHDMIRARLRLLGRFLIVLRDIDNSVVDFTSIYDPIKYEQCIKVVNKLAQFDETTETYKILSVASSLGRYIKQVGQVLKSMCIKKQEFHKQTVVEDFLKLFTENYLASINKMILETQEYKKRGQKNIVLPSIDDIEMFNTYLKFERTKALQFLQTTGFSIQAWRMLAETTLVSIMVFNRRHPGELERILIENLKNCAAISKEEAPELYKSLSKYVRMTIRDNLGRLVPVLLHEEILKCMQMIVNYRKHAGVPENNPYIFGIYTIDKNRYKYLKASVLMRKHSIISGLKIPTSLRNTILWEHIATVCISLAISEHEVNDLTDFKSHHEKINKLHYKQSVITNLAISRLFKYTQGEDASDESDVDEDENENDMTNDSNIHSILNISDTLSALTKTRQSEQLPIKEKDFNNHINNNIKKNKAPKRKINHNSENMTESDDEFNTELDLNISNTLSLKETKQSEEVFRRKNNVNNNTERNKKKRKVLN
ncbi:uncharacterized protein [Temnothorax longispinosus]|uniref:uncharacterized protein isoform X2 n=1 Tax=Temnothorax longispinosus TaxID=300112 RepID=UPI003A98F0FF